MAAVRRFLTENNWPTGLQETFMRNLDEVPMRYFICDDSGSMQTDDGRKLVTGSDGRQVVEDCTRWSELGSTMLFHAQLANLAGAPSEFRFLNEDDPIMIGTGTRDGATRMLQLQQIFRKTCEYMTPICHHIREVTEQIRALAPSLRASGQKVVVMIATDGISSDGDIAEALRPLEQLPVWVVIRLCTNQDEVVDYWNNVDTELELNMDVLDDLCGEAEEVTTNNPWLTYAEPMHRIREFGIPVREFDLLDESALTLDQARQFCALLLGGQEDDYPHPELDWNAFKRKVDKGLLGSPSVFCPLLLTRRPWISLPVLQGMIVEED